jgi:plasmid stabilization system protein ParE
VTFEVIFRKRASSELDRAFKIYEKERVGLGSEFIEELDEYLDELETRPKSFRVIVKNYRIAVMQRFPFEIFFFIDKQKVVIANIFHTSRRPLRKYLAGK